MTPCWFFSAKFIAGRWASLRFDRFDFLSSYTLHRNAGRIYFHSECFRFFVCDRRRRRRRKEMKSEREALCMWYRVSNEKSKKKNSFSLSEKIQMIRRLANMYVSVSAKIGSIPAHTHLCWFLQIVLGSLNNGSMTYFSKDYCSCLQKPKLIDRFCSWQCANSILNDSFSHGCDDCQSAINLNFNIRSLNHNTIQIKWNNQIKMYRVATGRRREIQLLMTLPFHLQQMLVFFRVRRLGAQKHSIPHSTFIHSSNNIVVNSTFRKPHTQCTRDLLSRLIKRTQAVRHTHTAHSLHFVSVLFC